MSAKLAIGAAAVLAAAGAAVDSLGSRALSLDELRQLAEAKRAAPAAFGGPVRVTAYVDLFAENEAPYVMEERLSESGRSYEVKVFTPDAYTEDYMERSDETGRLIRWAVRLSDGRMVSRDGAFRLRFPDQWERVRQAAARKRGEKRDEHLAMALWGLLSEDEREAMFSSVDLSSYADGRGIEAAKADLARDLRESGNLLFWAVGSDDWYHRLVDQYAICYLGGPLESPAWTSSSFQRFINFKSAMKGVPTVEVDPVKLPLVADKRVRPAGRKALAPWWGMSFEYWSNPPTGDRVAEFARIFHALRRRMGRTLHHLSMPGAFIPSAATPEGRRARETLWGQLRADMDPVWSASLDPDPRMLDELIAATGRMVRGFANFSAAAGG